MMNYKILKDIINQLNNNAQQDFLKTCIAAKKELTHKIEYINIENVSSYLKRKNLLAIKNLQRMILPLTDSEVYTKIYLQQGNFNKEFFQVVTKDNMYQFTNLRHRERWSKEQTEYKVDYTNLNIGGIVIKPYVIDVKNYTDIIDGLKVVNNIMNKEYDYKIIQNTTNVNKTVINQVIPSYFFKIQKDFDDFKKQLTQVQFNVLKQMPCYKGSYNKDVITTQLVNNNISMKQYNDYNKLNQALKNKDKRVKRYIHTIRRNRFINPRYLTVFYKVSITPKITVYYTALDEELLQTLVSNRVIERTTKCDKQVLKQFKKILRLQPILDEMDIVNRSVLTDINQLMMLVNAVKQNVYFQGFNYMQLMDFNKVVFNQNVYLTRNVIGYTRQSLIPVKCYKDYTTFIYYNRAKTGILHLFKKKVYLNGNYPDIEFLQDYLVDDKLAINDVSYAKMILSVLLNERNIDIKYIRVDNNDMKLQVYNTYNKLITRRIQDYNKLKNYDETTILQQVLVIEKAFKNIRQSYNKRYLKDIALRYYISDMFYAKKNTVIMKRMMNNTDFAKYYRVFLRTKVILQYQPVINTMVDKIFQTDINEAYSKQKAIIDSKRQQINKLRLMNLNDLIMKQLDKYEDDIKKQDIILKNNVTMIEEIKDLKIDVMQHLIKWINFIRTGQSYVVPKEATLFKIVVVFVAFYDLIQDQPQDIDLVDKLLMLKIQPVKGFLKLDDNIDQLVQKTQIKTDYQKGLLRKGLKKLKNMRYEDIGGKIRIF